MTTEFREIINDVYDHEVGGLDVNIQSQTSPLFQFFMMTDEKTDITLTSDIAVDDTVINVSAGHGFDGTGENIVIWDDNKYIQMEVVSVATDAITITHPIAQTFEADTAIVIRGRIDMNVDGSSTPVDFHMEIQNFTIPIDIGKIMITMQHGSNVPDDGKFGGLAALANGMWVRKENALKFNLGNYKTNQDFKEVGGAVEYTLKAPAGTNATNIMFDIEGVFGQVIRIDSRIDDHMHAQIRDNINAAAGMAKMTVSLIGSYTRGE